MDLIHALAAHHLATPLNDATVVAVDLREPAEQAHARLQEHDFDQAPLRDRGRWVGWVATKNLQGGTKIKGCYHALDASRFAGAVSSINDVLPHLAETGFCFTVGRGGLEGFITPSDLDRHAARCHFHVLISAVEMSLSSLIRVSVRESDVVKSIPCHQVGTGPEGAAFSLRLAYEEARASGRETHAVECLGLGDMVALLEKEGRILTSDLHKRLLKVRDLRNPVMHPTRSLSTLGAGHLARVADAAFEAQQELKALLDVSDG
ncbi:hypothetical protein [Blastococcus sp. SYSU DS1024]